MSASSEDLWTATKDHASQDMFSGDLFGEPTAPATHSPAPRSLEVIAAASPLFKRRSLQPESIEVIMRALGTDSVARRILAKNESLQVGQAIGVRLNLNVLKNTGVMVHTCHRATSVDGHTRGKGFYRGEVVSYQPVVVLRDAYFNVHQVGRQGIAAGTVAKHPMASVDGSYQLTDETLTFDGLQLAFNPKREHLFVDEEGFAVQYAEHVTIMGNRAFCRGVLRYFSSANAPMKAGDAPSAARFKS